VTSTSTAIRFLTSIILTLVFIFCGCSKESKPAPSPEVRPEAKTSDKGEAKAPKKVKRPAAKDAPEKDSVKGMSKKGELQRAEKNNETQKKTQNPAKTEKPGETNPKAVVAGPLAKVDAAAPKNKEVVKPPQPVKANLAKLPEKGERLGPVLNQPEAPEVAPLNINTLIVQKDIKKALGIKKGFVELPLAGQQPSPTYNHRRLVPRGAGPVLGLTIQVWRDHTIADGRRKYSAFLKSFPGASENRSVTNRTFFARSRYNENMYLGYFALRERTNVVLTCNSSVCNAETMHKIALATKKRLAEFVKN